jgi:hypothetical protein
MDNAIWGMLNDAEKELLRSVEPSALTDLDEDDLAALHDRVRRARNKYSKLYRRRAAAEVTEAGARAKGHDRHLRTAIKAEAFEEALARVSRLLAQKAKASADEIRRERIAMARAPRSGGAAPATPTAGKATGKAAAAPAKGSGRPAPKAKAKTPVSKKTTASNRASTARTQARRDAK